MDWNTLIFILRSYLCLWLAEGYTLRLGFQENGGGKVRTETRGWRGEAGCFTACLWL